ncbi:protein arginine N-methyltransferase 9-like isoform X2 [Apostichopus japonicus]
MLNDRKRNQGYYDALQRAVRKGHQKVLDIGSGTGLLSMLAIKAGASRVTACEMSTAMCDLAQAIITQNNMDEHIEMKNLKSTDMEPASSSQDRFSLVVTEIADAGLLGEEIIPTLQHAWSHLLEENKSREDNNLPQKQIIPAGASVFIQLIESDYIMKQHRKVNAVDILRGVNVTSKSVQATLDVSSSSSIIDGDTEPYSSENLSQLPGGWKPLTSPSLVYKFNFCQSEVLDQDHQTDSVLSLPIICSGRPDAIISWFDLHLDEESSLSSSPASGSCWEQAVYPICAEQFQDKNRTVLEVTQEDMVDIVCRCHPTWMSFRVKDIKSKRQEYSKSLSKPKTTEQEDLKSKYRVTDADSRMEISLNISSNKLAILNDGKYLNHLRESMQTLTSMATQGDKSVEEKLSVRISNPNSKLTVLDLSGMGISFFALKSMDILKNQLVGIISQSDGEDLVEEIFKSREEDLQYFKRCTLESTEISTLEDVSIIIADPVETGGILKANALEDIYVYGTRSSHGSVFTIPGCLKVHAVCVESEELVRNTRVIGSDPTLGVNVEKINKFKTYTQLDVYLPTLPHRALSDPFTTFSIDINQLVKCKNPMEVFIQDREFTLEATASGRISAIVYWFEMTMSSGVCLNTLDEDNHWMQAAFVIDKEVLVQPGDKIQVTAHFRNNSLSFVVRKY